MFKRIKTNKRFKRLIDKNDLTFLYFGSKNKSNKLESDLYDAFSRYESSDLASPSLMLLNNNYGEVPYG